MLSESSLSILIPFAAGAIVLAIPRKLKPLHEALSLLTSAMVLVFLARIFAKAPFAVWSFAGSPVLRIDHLAAFVALFIGLFGLLITLYSFGSMKDKEAANQYYAYLLWTLGGSIGAAFSNNLILLLCFWGFLGLTLYLLISLGGPESSAAAKKTFIIIGGSDAAMLLGIAIIWHLTGTFTLSDVKLEANTSLAAAAFLCLAIGAFAKAGAMPLHTWIPDSSEVAPVSVMAYLPASLDKLLGIYLLARISLDIFSVRPNSPVSVFLLVVGAVTIIAAVMMALVQHNLKRLLAYHAVSQVGYMVLGIGTANPIGIAGGLFHMVNNAIYKSCLFLSGGSVEKAAGTTELDRLGGLAHVMPITFATCLIASLSISGVPPFNGFFSKWMIYQGLVEMGKSGSRLWVVWLCVAMFGSALTLASFIKLLFSVFLSPRDPKEKGEADSVGEAPASMWIPQAALAVMCVIFGIFAYRLPIRYFIEPSLAAAGATISWSGIWNAPLAAILLLAGLCAGAVFFAVGKMAPIRRSSTFMGGEVLADRSGIKGTAFYNTIKELPVIGALYKLADKKVFDIYEEGSKGTFFLSGILQWLHNGVLPTYVVWCLIGMLLLFITFAR